MTNYSDLHCHPALYGFNRLRNGPHDGDPQRFHPWHVPDDVDHVAMGRGVRAATYTQCTMPLLVESGTRLVYGSITPIEQGFFVGDPHGEEPSFTVEVLRWVTGTALASSAGALVRGRRYEAGAHITRVLKNRGPARRVLQRLFLRYSPERIRYMQSAQLDYWDEFQREYQYYLNADGEERSGLLMQPDGTRRPVRGTYHLVRDGDHLQEVLATDDEIAVLLTIEGAHAFSIGTDGRRVPDDVLFERIEWLRELPHAISFVTLAHHFDNGLCGHAHSLPDAAGWVMDQSHRMEDDFRPIGLEAVRRLLGLDENLDSTGGRRILIDCKHMSPRARQTYYEQIVRPFNERARQTGEAPIPVVISHTAYSGVQTLDELIANADREDDNWHRPPFLAWGINHCDDDVRAVFHSDGLIGLVFDQRVCGLAPRQQLAGEHWIDLLVRHLFATVDVIWQDDRIERDQKHKIWDCVCLGTDFDGLIDPFTKYPTVLQFDELRSDLQTALQRHRHTRAIDEIGLEELVDKILWSNGVDFARRNL